MDEPGSTTDRCWPWSHKWTKWKPRYTEGIETSLRNGIQVEVSKFWQERRCQSCGRIQQEMLLRPGHESPRERLGRAA